MNISDIKFTNLHFGKGLSRQTLLKETIVNVNKQVVTISDQYGIEVSFMNNKSAALATKLCLDIFEELAKKINKKLFLPPAVFFYNKEDIINPLSATNFCIPDTCEVLKNEYPFPGRSIFFRNFKNLSHIDNLVESHFAKKEISTAHFLAPFIHEFMHSFQLDHIFNNFGYGGQCNYMSKIYPSKKGVKCGVELLKELERKILTPQENEIIFENLGEYSTKPFNQYLEIFAEGLTKFICESLNGTELRKNPIDLLLASGKEFQKIFMKICNFV